LPEHIAAGIGAESGDGVAKLERCPVVATTRLAIDPQPRCLFGEIP
jgi:hypothetical protein